ncbi:MAG: hypothetical protein P8P49_04385 [Opitutales bacterium]|nr:hypothetical protein [Opitutales bacterium]
MERNRSTIAAIAPPNTRKSKIRKIILGLFFFSGPAATGLGPPGGAPIGPGAGSPPGGGVPIAGIGGIAPPGAGSAGPPLGAVSAGFGPPGEGIGTPPVGSAGAGERDGVAKVGAGPGVGAGGKLPTLGKLGEGDTALAGTAMGAAGTGTVAPTEGMATGLGSPGNVLGTTGDGSPAEGGRVGADGMPVVGTAPVGEGNGAGVPSLGLILGANGERVTLNLGPPSPGLTGAPSLGVNLRVGFGGLGNPSGIRLLIQKGILTQGKRKIYSLGVFFSIKSEISSIDAFSIDFPLRERSSKVLKRVSVILSWVFSEPPKIENLSA